LNRVEVSPPTAPCTGLEGQLVAAGIVRDPARSDSLKPRLFAIAKLRKQLHPRRTFILEQVDLNAKGRDVRGFCTAL